MRQIIVGGDNQEAYTICDVLEEEVKDDGVPVLFCTTPQEVLSNLGRAGADLVVLNFERAGLTNFELAHRIREMGSGHTMPLLLPEIDALGDIRGTLGKNAAAFTCPIKPENVAEKAKQLLNAAAREAGSATGSHEAADASPDLPKEIQRIPKPKLKRVETKADSPHSPPLEAETASRHAVEEEAPRRNRRVRRRTWDDIKEKRKARKTPGVKTQAAVSRAIRDDDIVIYENQKGTVSDRRKRALLGVLAAAIVLAVLWGGVSVVRALLTPDSGNPKLQAVVKCTSCDYRQTRIVENIHDTRCRKCGAPLGFAYHCHDCDKDIAFVPREGIKTIRQVNEPTCPECKSWNVKAIEPGTGKTETAEKQDSAAAEEDDDE